MKATLIVQCADALVSPRDFRMMSALLGLIVNAGW